MLNDLVTSLIRTVVPIAVGWVVFLLANIGLDVDSSQVAGFLTALFGAVWYTLARWIEGKYPNFGWLLGSPKQPVYGTTNPGG